MSDAPVSDDELDVDVDAQITDRFRVDGQSFERKVRRRPQTESQRIAAANARIDRLVDRVDRQAVQGAARESEIVGSRATLAEHARLIASQNDLIAALHHRLDAAAVSGPIAGVKP